MVAAAQTETLRQATQAEVELLRLDFSIGAIPERGLILFNALSTTGCADRSIFATSDGAAWTNIGSIPDADFVHRVRSNGAGRLALIVECDGRQSVAVATLDQDGFIAESSPVEISPASEVVWLSETVLYVDQVDGGQEFDISTGEVLPGRPQLEGFAPLVAATDPGGIYALNGESWSCSGGRMFVLPWSPELSADGTADLPEPVAVKPEQPLEGVREVQVSGSTVAWRSWCEPFGQVHSAVIGRDGSLEQIVEHDGPQSRVIESLTRIGPDGFVLLDSSTILIWWLEPDTRTLTVQTSTIESAG